MKKTLSVLLISAAVTGCASPGVEVSKSPTTGLTDDAAACSEFIDTVCTPPVRAATRADAVSTMPMMASTMTRMFRGLF